MKYGEVFMDNFAKYLFVFILGSIFGCMLETIWCIIKNRRYESRKGLIYGYLIPIYGMATLLLTFLIDILKIESYFKIYLLTFTLGFIIEYISSYLQEKIFKTKSWDYSKLKFNIGGRVFIPYLCIWSILGVLWAKFIPKYINLFLRFLKVNNLILPVTILSLIYMIFDIFLSVVATYRQKLRRQGIKAKNKFDIFIDRKYNDDYLKKVYANSVVIK